MPLTLLEDHVAVGPLLGRGGFGVVRKGTLRAGGDPVAVKLGTRPMDEEMRRRVLREVELLAGLSHPNLARLRSAHDDGHGGLALVYDLVPGESLDRVLARREAAPGELAGWIRDIAAGLGALHRAGLIHRDLKPGNLMLRPDGGVTVLDFGLARSQEQGRTVTETGVVLGTPTYMAPEQLAGERLGPAADSYALACVVYRALSGAPPFEGNAAELMRAHLGRPPPPLSGRRPDLPRELDRLLAGALAKDPAARPALAELVDGLARVLRKAPLPSDSRKQATRVHRTTLPRPREPSTRRRSQMRRLRTSLPVVLLLALAFGWFMPDSRPEEPPTPGPATVLPTHPERGPFEEDVPALLMSDLAESAGWLVDDSGTLYRQEDPPPGRRVRPALDGDPLVAARRLGEFRGLEVFRRWLARGGRPEALPAELRERLVVMERRFLEQDFPPPFGPLLQLRPDREPAPPPGPEDYPGVEYPPMPGPARGWGARFYRELSALFRLHASMERELAAATPGNAPGGIATEGIARATIMARRAPVDYIRFFSQRPVYRAKIAGWVSPLADRMRGAFLAAMRSIREEPETAAQVCWDAVEYLPVAKAGMYSYVAGLDSILVLGREPESPLEWALAATLADLQGTALNHLGEIPWRNRALARARELYRRAESVSGPASKAPWVRGAAFLGQIEIGVDQGLHEGIPALIDRFRVASPELPQRKREDFLREVFQYWGRFSRRELLDRERLRWCVEEFRRIETEDSRRGPPGESLQRLEKFLG